MSHPTSGLRISGKHPTWRPPGVATTETFAGDGATVLFTLATGAAWHISAVTVAGVDVTATAMIDLATGGVTVAAAPAAAAVVVVSYIPLLAVDTYYRFNKRDGLRGLKIGPLDLMRSWDDRSSVGDEVKQNRPNICDEYAEIAFSFVSLFGHAGAFQRFIEHCELDANSVQPITLKYEYQTGDEDTADFGVGANKNPVETTKVVMTEGKFIPFGEYLKTRSI